MIFKPFYIKSLRLVLKTIPIKFKAIEVSQQSRIKFTQD
jgi:hypothetical protein